MRKGIKLFEHFTQIHLEVCITEKDRIRFENQYILATGETPHGKDGYYERMLNNKSDAWGIEYRVYFKVAYDWVIESLTKLGYYVEQPKHMIAVELNKHHPDHEYKLRVASTELFWWLIEYGYRLGENTSIPYNSYLLKQYLREHDFDHPLFRIIKKESENPIIEAKMFVA